MSPCSRARSRRAARNSLRGSGAKDRTKERTWPETSTRLVNRGKREELQSAGLVRANGSHGFRICQQFERLGNCFHPPAGNKIGDCLIAAPNRNRTMRGIFQEPGKI